MTGEAKVSIIVPVYNEEIFLEPCVRSILNQTYQNIEIILVDDGSINKAGMICDQFAEEYTNLTVLHKKNGGLSMARIDGMKRAAGEWIMFVDHDDIISPYMVEGLMRGATDNIDIVAGRRLDTDQPEGYPWEFHPL